MKRFGFGTYLGVFLGGMMLLMAVRLLLDALERKQENRLASALATRSQRSGGMHAMPEAGGLAASLGDASAEELARVLETLPKPWRVDRALLGLRTVQKYAPFFGDANPKPVVALDRITTMTVAAVKDLQLDRKTRYVVPSDRVIGVEIRGAARAYPVAMLAWHEVINDVVGGEPIVVTYNPLSDAAVVLSRRLSHTPAAGAELHASDEVLWFDVAPVLYNSNLVLADRRGADRRSLWSPLEARAIAGPATGEVTLRRIPTQCCAWQEWQTAHPATDVMGHPNPAEKRTYRAQPYGQYPSDDRLLYPVRPLASLRPEAEVHSIKTQVIAVRAGGEWRAYPLPLIRIRAGEPREEGGPRAWETEQAGVKLRFLHRDGPLTAAAMVNVLGPSPTGGAQADAPAIEYFACSWFAWCAAFPDQAASSLP